MNWVLEGFSQQNRSKSYDEHCCTLFYQYTNTYDIYGSARNVLRDFNINGPVARRNPLVSQANRAKRFSFAPSIKKKSLDFWKTVVIP